MPNIEIYEDIFREAGLFETSLKPKIDDIIKDLGFENEAITTVIECYPRSCDGKNESKSYIRICSNDENQIDSIVKAFKKHKLGVDVETLLLSEFFSAEEMK